MVLPDELLNLADESGYSQVAGYYENRPGMVEPPYVYGYLPGYKQDSAAFWCVRDDGAYILKFMYKEKPDKGCDCPDEIVWHNPPKGLSIYKDESVTLDRFVYIDNPKEHGPEGVHLKHNAISSEYDGVAQIFYCHEGRWMVMMID